MVRRRLGLGKRDEGGGALVEGNIASSCFCDIRRSRFALEEADCCGDMLSRCLASISRSTV